MKKRRFILKHKLAPGDVVASTAVVRDIKLKYGDDVEVDFRTNFDAIYEHNPHLTPITDNGKGVEKITLCYGKGITAAAKEKVHFTSWFHRDFNNKSGLDVTPLHSKPDLHLSEYEKNNAPITGRYWLVFGGGKLDMTTKHWDYNRYQEVVDRLRPYGLRFVQSGALKKGHIHPPIDNVLNIVGWGHVRQLMWQIYHAEGVICPITCAMHMAAAFDKPCVVIAGGREEPWWEAYVDDYGAFGLDAANVPVPHKYLHTLGLLDCCATKGCWRKKVTKINRDTSLCHRPVQARDSSQIIPDCMDMITADHVIEAVMDYYEDGTLTPLGQPKELAML